MINNFEDILVGLVIKSFAEDCLYCFRNFVLSGEYGQNKVHILLVIFCFFLLVLPFLIFI